MVLNTILNKVALELRNNDPISVNLLSLTGHREKPEQIHQFAKLQHNS
jgi:hypothetical protein